MLITVEITFVGVLIIVIGVAVGVWVGTALKRRLTQNRHSHWPDH